jgi:hypothetical protein
MFLNSVFSGSLLSFPILITLAIYLGINWQHISDTIIKGQIPEGWTPNSGGGSITNGKTGKLRVEQYCQKAYGIEPYPGRYIRKYLPSLFFFYPLSNGKFQLHARTQHEFSILQGIFDPSQPVGFIHTLDFHPKPMFTPLEAAYRLVKGRCSSKTRRCSRRRPAGSKSDLEKD